MVELPTVKYQGVGMSSMYLSTVVANRRCPFPYIAHVNKLLNYPLKTCNGIGNVFARKEEHIV